EDGDHDDLADDDRNRAEVARAQVQPGAIPEACEAGAHLLLVARRGGARPDDVGVCNRHGSSSTAAGIPETFVGVPAVIASTTACCVVERRSNTPTLRPRRSTVMRSAVSNTSWRLCEIRTTASPCSPRRRTS